MGAGASKNECEPQQWRGYGSDGYKDTDWGCVYRSFQNAVAAVTAGSSPPSMPTLVAHVGRGRGAWAEPADFTGRWLFPGAASGALLEVHATPWVVLMPQQTRGGVNKAPTADLFRFTSARQYTPWPNDVSFPKEAPEGRNTAYVVDDGVSGYAIVPVRVPCVNGSRTWAWAWAWVDPHTEPGVSPRPTPFHRQHHLGTAPGWMVLQVERVPHAEKTAPVSL